MNRVNRQRHRRAFSVLALALPAGLAAAFALRVPPARMDALPDALAGLHTSGQPDREIAWTGLPLQAQLFIAEGRVRVVATEPLRLPDPLGYWASSPPQGRELPQDARLLGSYNDTSRQTFALDQPAESGVVLVYSPLSGQVFGYAPLGDRL